MDAWKKFSICFSRLVKQFKQDYKSEAQFTVD